MSRVTKNENCKFVSLESVPIHLRLRSKHAELLPKIILHIEIVQNPAQSTPLGGSYLGLHYLLGPRSAIGRAPDS